MSLKKKEKEKEAPLGPKNKSVRTPPHAHLIHARVHACTDNKERARSHQLIFEELVVRRLLYLIRNFGRYLINHRNIKLKGRQ